MRTFAVEQRRAYSKIYLSPVQNFFQTITWHLISVFSCRFSIFDFYYWKFVDNEFHCLHQQTFIKNNNQGPFVLCWAWQRETIKSIKQYISWWKLKVPWAKNGELVITRTKTWGQKNCYFFTCRTKKDIACILWCRNWKKRNIGEYTGGCEYNDPEVNELYKNQRRKWTTRNMTRGLFQFEFRIQKRAPKETNKQNIKSVTFHNYAIICW